MWLASAARVSVYVSRVRTRQRCSKLLFYKGRLMHRAARCEQQCILFRRKNQQTSAVEMSDFMLLTSENIQFESTHNFQRSRTRYSGILLLREWNEVEKYGKRMFLRGRKACRFIAFFYIASGNFSFAPREKWKFVRFSAAPKIFGSLNRWKVFLASCVGVETKDKRTQDS